MAPSRSVVPAIALIVAGSLVLTAHARLAEVALAVLVVNLPFGYWRAGVRRYTLAWFLAVHAPVPLVVGFRVLAGLGWRLSTVLVLAVAFLAGQLLGGRLRHWWGGIC